VRVAHDQRKAPLFGDVERLLRALDALAVAQAQLLPRPTDCR